MFTGIIESVGTVRGFEDVAGFSRLHVDASGALDGAAEGSSIAVNGVCLTAQTIGSDTFSADLSAETVARTTLGSLPAGTVVNIERSMRADSRFDGHIVQGHVDTTGVIVAFDRSGNDWRLRLQLPDDRSAIVVEKGSIAIDGISLTVAALRGREVEIAIIPHTFENTNLRQAAVGQRVNIEYDVIAKYVARLVMPYR